MITRRGFLTLLPGPLLTRLPARLPQRVPPAAITVPHVGVREVTIHLDDRQLVHVCFDAAGGRLPADLVKEILRP
jgi:hypothetical protein